MALESKRLALALLIAALAFACVLVLRPFVAPVAWSLVLCYVTWPVYRIVRRPFGRFRSLAALAMVLLVSAVLVLPSLWLIKAITDESRIAFQSLSTAAANGRPLPQSLRSIPWLGDELQRQVARWQAEPATIGRELGNWMRRSTLQITSVLGRVGRGASELFVTLLTAFFVYRDAGALARSGRRALDRLVGGRVDPYLQVAATTTRAVAYGLLVTSVAQGLVAGLGYWMVGVEGAALFGALTGVLSVVPVLGTSLVWGSVALYLIAAGHAWRGIALLAWGMLAVHPTDNLIRPLLISNIAKIPFLPTFFGVIGGIAAFGLIGAIIGPVVLAIALALWRDWIGRDPLAP
jgi:predicted PurR-regulated permease PerM